MILRTTSVRLFNISQSRICYVRKSNFYNVSTQLDTIFAPATAIDQNSGSPLGVVRFSGKQTENVLRLLTNRDVCRIYQTNSRAAIKPRLATNVKILHPNTKEVIDLALTLWFPAPKSYTGEDVAELHLHGSHAVMTSVLNILGSLEGLRPAEPGEFTRRALINGKMSLVEAESLPDFIASKTDSQRRLALSGLDGSIRLKYEQWIESLIKILAHLEASIDFGEDELLGEQRVVAECKANLRELAKQIQKHIKYSSRSRQVIRDGVKVVILGRPNAGKSTLMNLLCQREKSIVSDLSGTTRDIVEHTFELGGYAMKLHDTAGLRIAADTNKLYNDILARHEQIENEGMRRALQVAESADIILYLMDASPLLQLSSNMETGKIYELIANEIRESFALNNAKLTKCMLYLIFNKIDLTQTNVKTTRLPLNSAKLKKMLNLSPQLDLKAPCLVSCKTLVNYERFVEKLIEDVRHFVLHRNRNSKNPSLIDRNQKDEKHDDELSYINERHLALLQATQRDLLKASEIDFKNLEISAQYVRDATDYLSRIVGCVSNEQILDVVFRDFCIGK